MIHMTKITTIGELREAIRELEHQNYVNEQHMRNRVTGLADRLKPINIVKGLLGNILGGASERKTSLLKLAAGIATSFLVKKFFRKSIPFK
jgi:hypothetical protein